MKDITPATILARLPGVFRTSRGNLDTPIRRASSLDEAVAQEITFCKAPERLAEVLPSTRASAVVVPASALELPCTASATPTLLFADNPRLAFLRVVQEFFAPRVDPGIHATAIVHPSATIAASAFVGPYAVIDADCEVGEHSVIHAHVHLYANCRLGARVVVHSGTVIGADGYGYERNEDGELEKFVHVGGVRIEDDVEIGSNTSIDRGTLGDTLIKRGAKIDNQCHISHNVVVGAHTAVIAQSMIGGSVRIGDHSWVAPSAAVFNQARIGDRATIGIGAVVNKTVPDDGTVMGVPARSSDEFRALQRLLKDLLSRS